MFRAAEHVPAVLVDDLLARGLKQLWLQDGIVHEAAAARAVAAGVTVVMDRCMSRDYARSSAEPRPGVTVSELIRFTKMHGAGNDFVVLDCIAQAVDADRRSSRARSPTGIFGVGCDQILLVERARGRDAPISATAYSMPTAARSSSAATARAASCASCTSRA